MLQKSVGNAAKNDKPDVRYVQTLLNNHLREANQLSTDGLCGPKTIKAIINFQAEVAGFARPDGKVDPGGKTIKTLEKPTAGFSNVPLAAGVAIKATKPKPSTSPKAPPKNDVVLTPVATGSTDPRKLTSRQAIANVYGAITVDNKWARQSEFLASFTVPSSIQNHKDYQWVNTYSAKKSKVTNVYCHKAMHNFLTKALNNLVSRGQLANLTEFGGSFNIRATRGTTNWSAHSWGLAIDINMTGNGLGKQPAMTTEFAQCFKDAGFGWGGNYSRKDGMHFTIAGFDMPKA